MSKSEEITRIGMRQTEAYPVVPGSSICGIKGSRAATCDGRGGGFGWHGRDP
jgi:hypothetical protein